MQKIITLPITGTAVPDHDPRFLMTYAEREELLAKCDRLEAERDHLRKERRERIRRENRLTLKLEIAIWSAAFFGFSAVMLGFYCLILGG